MMKKVLKIFMSNNHFLFIGFLAFSVFSCTTSSYMAYIENEDEFEKSDFKFTVIDTWTTYNRNCKIGDYFIEIMRKNGLIATIPGTNCLKSSTLIFHGMKTRNTVGFF